MPPSPSKPSAAPERRPGLLKRLRTGVIRGALPTLVVLFRPLPWRVVLAAGWLLGKLAYHAQPRRRRRARENLARSLGDQLDRKQLRAIERRVFTRLGMNLTELCWVAARPSRIDRLVEIDGEENIEAALARGKGVIMLTGHLGSWELVAAALVRRGIPLSVIAREMSDERVNDFILGLRSRLGVQTVVRGSYGAARAILRTLRAGEMLATLIDQDIKVDGIFVDFFGRPAYTPAGPVALAVKTGAAVVPGLTWRKPDGRHIGRAEPPVILEPGEDENEAIRRHTAGFTRWLEERIREHPDQWVWIHRRWRRQPPAAQEPGGGAD